MVTIERTFQLTGGTPPYNLSITTDTNCVTLSYPTPNNGVFTVVMEVSSEDCFPFNLVFSGTDADGCPINLPNEEITNDCDTFVLNPISFINTGSTDIILTVSASSPSCQQVEFEWVFNNLLFEQISVTDGNFESTIQLRPREGVSFPANTIIAVNATDCRGCQKTVTYNYNFCVPDAFDFPLSLFCVDGVYTTPVFSFPDPVGNCVFTIDWTTLQTILPNGWILEVVDAVARTYRIIAPLSTPAGVYTGFWSVATTDGIRTDNGIITFSVIECDGGPTITIADFTWFLDCAAIPGDIVEIPIEGLITIQPGATIDWTSWTLTTPPTPLSPSITLGNNAGGQYVILYEVPNPVSPDIFSWTVCDTDGNCASAGVITVVDCVDAPIANDDDACVSCAETIFIDVLANDDGNGSPLIGSTIIITTPPTNGSAGVSGGQIVYTPISNFSGVDTLTYTVENGLGATSNEATVTIEVACAGNGGSIIVCV